MIPYLIVIFGFAGVIGLCAMWFTRALAQEIAEEWE